MTYYSQGQYSFLLDKEFSAWNRAEYFDSLYWQRCGYLTNIAEGRGCTWFFSWQQQDFVLRHYHRGGKIARLVSDRYLYTGLSRTRPWREWHLLDHLYRNGFPVPKPIAAYVVRTGFWYKADIIMQRIDDTKTFAEYLRQKIPKQDIWLELGKLIARFHGAGVYHADLNAHNILIDTQSKLWLIDFDKSELRTPTPNWQEANVSRLKRSLLKLTKTGAIKQFGENQWDSFMSGYQENPTVVLCRSS